MAQSKPSRSRVVLNGVIAFFAVVAFVSIVLALMALQPTKNNVQHYQVDSYSGAAPVASATPTATPTVRATSSAAPVAPTAFSVVATRTMTFSPTLQPADFVNVFYLIDPAHGYLSTGTTYLITHSMAKGSGAPGNAWEGLKVGDTVKYNGHIYLINYTATPAQSAIGKEPIWGANNSKELVMITCKSRGTAATNNFVIRAYLVS